MLVYPVIDLMRGVVVHGAGGVRERYRPIRSRLVEGCSPLEVARALRSATGIERLYVADLDAIAGGAVAAGTLAGLAADGFRLLADCGARTRRCVAGLVKLGVAEVVIALETGPEVDFLTWAVERLGEERAVFSLDCRGSAPVAALGTSGRACVNDVVEVARAAGTRRILLLDLLRVGSAAGPLGPDGIRGLCERFPDCRFLVGGGVRDRGDLERLAAAGADGVLLATALHEGRVGRGDLGGTTDRTDVTPLPGRPGASGAPGAALGARGT